MGQYLNVGTSLTMIYIYEEIHDFRANLILIVDTC
jgi:hypothetical protein